MAVLVGHDSLKGLESTQSFSLHYPHHFKLGDEMSLATWVSIRSPVKAQGIGRYLDDSGSGSCAFSVMQIGLILEVGLQLRLHVVALVVSQPGIEKHHFRTLFTYSRT